MNITRHMTLSNKRRQQHIDLTTDCYGYIVKQGKNKGAYSLHLRHPKKALRELLGIDEFKSYSVNVCHKCLNDSTAPNGFICMNPLHLYFGTPSENSYDKAVSNRTKPGKTSIAGNKHNTKKLHTCPHCGRQIKGPAYFSHVKACTATSSTHS